MFLFLAPAVLAGSLLAQSAMQDGVTLQRVGPNEFVQIRTGVVIQTASSRLAIRAPGRVLVQGGNGNQISYKLIRHVKTRSEIDAHRLLSPFTVRLRESQGLIEVMFAYSDLQSELQVAVPRTLAMVFVHADAGDLEAYDLDGSVQAETNAGLIRCDRIRGGVRAETGAGEIRCGRVGGAARCTSGGGSISIDSVGGDAACQTMGGEITIREAAGPLVLNTRGGNIYVERAASNVEAHSGEGVIEVLQAGGSVSADTRGGSIQVGSAHGVKCDSAQGTVRLKTGSGPLQVSTAVGNILAELLPGTRFENALLSAGSGDITVLIPSNLSLSILARNDSGGNPRIFSDFPSVQAKNFGFSKPPVLAEGAINGGGQVLRVAVTAGVIFLKKSK